MPNSSVSIALTDFGLALQQWRTWIFWAQHELHQRYRRSFLGPLWISFNMGFHILVMGLVWGLLFKVEYSQYIPYVALGLIMWGLIAGILAEGASCFISMHGMITQTSWPIPSYFFKLVYRNVLNFAHNMVIYVIAAVYFKVIPSSHIVFLPIAILLLVLGVGWVGFIFAMISVRYRDIPNLVQSVLVVIMLVTPIMFRLEHLGKAAFVAELNPVFHLIELVRAPLLGGTARPEDWYWSVGVTLFGWLFALVLYGRYRNRIAYWV